ncbi:sensor histidine kinase [Clostridium luticellarii]|uniref:sensor histidine kinase n=3 Tax=Clostridium luticellarii TaxID=1691940 RepID=UPI002353BA2C|nr:HAMP domain-containing sensor histidine kinase [Clostridium luticellarii]MCI1946454.1 HAMP domain-containing histidine kinase [Clostridium luticellarii]MCI1967450.1 HAMP domain-containing histidine kinase [Clostridium luticellarii]
MEYIWVITTFLLIFMFIILVFYHLYYRMNIKHITRQLKEIMNIDTNQLLTVTVKQRDITEVVNQLNNLIRDVRLSRIGIKRLNRDFRRSIINISHDLRTPLTTASGYVQMLQAGAADEEQQEYLAIVLERQNMVKTLLEQLFEYVRIESGEITYEHVPMDAKKVLMDTLVMYYDDFYRKGEEPAVHFPEKPCIIRGDEQGVKRIFSNILFNAIVHGKGEYCFEIQESKESASYMFTFSNLSEPMSRDDLDCIFERFYTKDKSRNKKTTGLGLTIAREITRQLNGTIEAFYNNGKFSISALFPKV